MSAHKHDFRKSSYVRVWATENASSDGALMERIKNDESAEAGIQDGIPIFENDGDSNERYLPFRSVRDFFAQVDACIEETFLIFSPVSAAQYEAVAKFRERRARKFRIDLWDEGELWVRAGTSTAHESLHGCTMGLEYDWESTGSATFYKAGGGSAGEGDSSRKPGSERPSPTGWPTLVIEAGYPQSMRKLRQKARWWFEASNFDVKIVLPSSFGLAKLFWGEVDSRPTSESYSGRYYSSSSPTTSYANPSPYKGANYYRQPLSRYRPRSDVNPRLLPGD
ncbi:hypothetical protein QBC46DRAFT_403480 [Diplogelasinospora grovesii]|uniref:Uncharacterized protein n=1 Tax=Diplogelasinospora grovesii TaxID=303347 RepID=A0AAN6NHK4_9PEZI|nr:hypothetical protein QBC46DRAFT_403480 [Diplogelasinospora grovesii]